MCKCCKRYASCYPLASKDGIGKSIICRCLTYWLLNMIDSSQNRWTSLPRLAKAPNSSSANRQNTGISYPLQQFAWSVRTRRELWKCMGTLAMQPQLLQVTRLNCWPLLWLELLLNRFLDSCFAHRNLQSKLERIIYKSFRWLLHDPYVSLDHLITLSPSIFHVLRLESWKK